MFNTAHTGKEIVELQGADTLEEEEEHGGLLAELLKQCRDLGLRVRHAPGRRWGGQLEGQWKGQTGKARHGHGSYAGYMGVLSCTCGLLGVCWENVAMGQLFVQVSMW